MLSMCQGGGMQRLHACFPADFPRSAHAHLNTAGTRVVAVAAGMEHSLALTEGGEVYSWGTSEHGRLGHGSPTGLHLFGSAVEFKPRLIRAFEALRIKQVWWMSGWVGGGGAGVVFVGEGRGVRHEQLAGQLS